MWFKNSVNLRWRISFKNWTTEKPMVQMESIIFLQNCIGSLSYPLSKVFEKSLESWVLPKIWKKANKPVSKQFRTNFIFFIANKFICADQHRFLPNRSCIINLIESLDIITDSCEKRLSVDKINTDKRFSDCKRAKNRTGKCGLKLELG